MKRNLWLIPIVLAVSVTGVAGLSAFESYLLNVSVVVENSLSLPTQSVALGGPQVHPKEWHTFTLNVELSDSFIAQDRVNALSYQVCAQPKPGTYPNPSVGFSSLWLGGAAFINVKGDKAWHWIGDTRSIDPPPAGFVCPGVTGTLNRSQSTLGIITLGFDVPVFLALSAPNSTNLPRPDIAVCGQGTFSDPQAARDEPCVEIPIPPGAETGTDLGMDLVIQVTEIN